MDTTGPPEGTWQYDLGHAVTQFSTVTAHAVQNYAFDNPGVIFGTSIGLLLCGTAMGLRIIWRRPENKLRGVFNRYIRNPVSRKLLGPVRRFHRRWSARNQRAKMAKWRDSRIADEFEDALFKLCEEKVISRQQKRRLANKLAEFFGLPDLARRKTHPDVLAARLKANNTSKFGPVKPIPGPKPGENTIPLYQGLGGGYLDRKKAASA